MLKMVVKYQNRFDLLERSPVWGIFCFCGVWFVVDFACGKVGCFCPIPAFAGMTKKGVRGCRVMTR